MSKLKSERHHWWPRCVSKHWQNEEGFTNFMDPEGSSRRAPPAKLGMIGNGHHIKFGTDPSQGSPWDTSFEGEFDIADSEFPNLICWLEALARAECFRNPLTHRFLAQSCTDEQLTKLTECVVSLVVRSPSSRHQHVSLAEHFRGPLPNAERNVLIGLNMRHTQRMISENIGCRAKFVVLYSSGKEFIYGDGLFNNIAGITNPPLSPTILAPITPKISVLIARPLAFDVEPRLSTFVLTDQEVRIFNDAVQVYSKDAIFYRDDKPELIDDFKGREFRRYAGFDNPVENFVKHIPGVASSRPSLVFLNDFR